ncbi:MAG: hypothetical protein FJ128_07580 [Deltaproteobacteria bacterium]|nr:hypothetical protein [Deltaproteobacteria bacterium]
MPRPSSRKWLIVLGVLAAAGLLAILWGLFWMPSGTAPRPHQVRKAREAPEAAPEAAPKKPGGARYGGHTIRSQESQE